LRGHFISHLAALAERDARVILLTADLGYMAVEPFADRHPDRFFNTGVAEQNMVGLATGLAEAGFIPFVYSIAPFATLRPYEFIRNGPILHRLPVRIVGVGGGMEYATNGLTHYALEDVGALRIQPSLTVVVPADHQQAVTALDATWNLPGPIYYRLGKDDKRVVPGLNGRFARGQAERVRDGHDLLLVSMGAISSEAVAAAELLSRQGVEASVMVVASLNPAPVNDLAEALSRFSAVLTVEEHYRDGGVGSLVAEVIAERGIRCRLRRCAVDATPDRVTGSHRYMLQASGLCGDQVAAAAQAMLRIPA
jgi:transketolase